MSRHARHRRPWWNDTTFGAIALIVLAVSVIASGIAAIITAGGQ